MADDPRETENARDNGNGDFNQEDAPNDLLRGDGQGDESEELVELHDDQANAPSVPDQELGSVHYGNQVFNPQGEQQQTFRRRNASSQRQERNQAAEATEKQTIAQAEQAEFDRNVDTGADTADSSAGAAGADDVSLKSDPSTVDLPESNLSTNDTTDLRGERDVPSREGRESLNPDVVPTEEQAAAVEAEEQAPDETEDTQDDTVDDIVEDVVEDPKVADAPDLVAGDVSGSEDSAISLNVSAALNDLDGGNETLTIVISGVPDGAILSAGTDNGDGTWSLSAGQLAGLTITPADDFSGSFDLSVTATSRESNGTTASSSSTMTVDVAGVADGATLDVSNASGSEDSAIALSIDTELLDGSESLSITISGVPDRIAQIGRAHV